MARSNAALLFAALLTAASPAPPATDLLRSAMNAPQRVSYVGEVQVLRIGRQRSNVAIFRIEHKAPDMTRRWYLAPQGLYGDSIVNHAGRLYSIDVKREQVTVAPDEAEARETLAQGNYGLLTSNYDVVYAPDANIEGRTVHVVLLNNKFTGQTTMRLHIDAKTHLVLERQVYGANGSLVSQMRIEQIRYTNAIPTALFDIPANLKRVDAPGRGESSDVQHVIASAGFNARVPKYLPEGFTPIAGDVSSIKNVPTLHLLYSDGVRTVSLFQNEKDAAVDLSRYKASDATVADHPARYVEDGPTTLLAWSDGARHFALVGDLSLTELEKIGASVVP
jgi:negative regulator of sigma E activity